MPIQRKVGLRDSDSVLSIMTTNSARGLGPGFEYDDSTSIGGLSRASCLIESEAFAEEDEEEEWKNMAEEIFRAWRGDEAYEMTLKKDLKYPAPWLGSQLALKFAAVRLKSLSKVTHALTGNHQTYVGATGFCTVYDNQDIPNNPFFIRGKIFRVRMRFSNSSIPDDAGVDVRGAAIKLEEVGSESNFDLIMETGQMKFTENAAHEIAYQRSVVAGTHAREEFLLHRPQRLTAHIEAIRRAPLSFSMMTYYTKVTYVVNSDDGTKRFGRFRLVPACPVKDTGLLTVGDQVKNWMSKERLPGETRSVDYLRKGLKSRLRRRPVKFYLELQLQDSEGEKGSEHVCNAIFPWDESQCPWLPLAEVILTTSMMDAMCRSTHFSVSSHPPCFGFLSAKSKHDPNSIAFVQGISLACSHMNRSDDTVDVGAVYHIHLAVETLFLEKSDTLRMKIILNGPEGSTAPVDVTSYAQPLPVSNIAKSIKSPDIGKPFALEIILETASDVIALHDISIMNEKHESLNKMVVHRVICNRDIIAICEAKTCFREQHHFLAELRKFQIREKQNIYGWMKISTLPARLTVKQSEISRDFIPVRNVTQKIDAMYRMCDTKLELHMNFLSEGDFGDYAQAVFPYSKEVKHIASTWHTDTEYVNQFLAPTMLLRRCKNRLPSNFCVDDSTIQEIIGQRRPLHEEIKEGKIYLADYSFLTPLTQVSGRGFYYCAPIAAFHVNDDGILVPLAVQLGQRPGEVWTPKDPEDEWQLAKAYVKCSDQQADLIHHSLLARIVEAVANATLRKMPSFHPVHTLLMPYFRPILAMNMSSREVLTLVEKITGINRRQYSKIGEHLYRDFHIDQQFVPNCFEAVGTHDPKKLPHYPYRQKALRAWDNMSAYVTDFILAHYTNNDDVMNDEEVQSWVREIYRDALPQYDAEGYRYSGKIRTVNQLCTLITWMVFEASFRLPALTTNIWERASVIANAPLVMKRTPPLMKGLVQTMTLMTSFPGRLEAPSILALCTLFQEFASKFRAFESEGTVNNNKDG